MRAYGLPDPTRYVKGSPKIVKEIDRPCPVCKCEKTFMVEVELEGMELLRGGNGRGCFVGCACCPFASPMIAVAITTAGGEDD